jgi:hypothetical protein
MRGKCTRMTRSGGLWTLACDLVSSFLKTGQAVHSVLIKRPGLVATGRRARRMACRSRRAGVMRGFDCSQREPRP